MSQVSDEATVPGRSEQKKTRVWNLYFSADAFRWSPYKGNPVIRPSGVPKVNPEGEPWAQTTGYQSYLWGPTASVGWDSIRKVYAMHMENCQHKGCSMQMRLIGRTESPDLIHWIQPSTIILPDDLDPPDLQFYSMWATTYEGFYIGMLWICQRGYLEWQIRFERYGLHADQAAFLPQERQAVLIPIRSTGDSINPGLAPISHACSPEATPIRRAGRRPFFTCRVGWRLFVLLSTDQPISYSFIHGNRRRTGGL